MDQSQLFKVKSYGLSLYMAGAGFPVRGAVIEPDGRASYLFDAEASHAIPAFQIVKATLDRAQANALAQAGAR